jgi:ComF family protein
MEWRCTFPKWTPTAAVCRSAGRRLGRSSQRWLSSCANLVFPPACLLCGEASPGSAARICPRCETALTADGAARCPRCAKPLPEHARADADGCPLCRDKRWRFQHAVALGTYGGEVRNLILRIKQPRHESLCLAAGELLATRIAGQLNGSLPDLVAPVPMHWLRKLWRGMNDSELLSEAVAEHLRLPLHNRLLRCLRATRKQGTLLPTERRLNVRGAYGVRRRNKVSGAHVLVVDDVMTTGATANELARILSNAGAARVTVAVVARGVGFD